MDDLISRKQAIRVASGYCHWTNIPDELAKLPSVNPQASNEDIHREREQAYMKGYEDASNRYRTEPCGDAISRVAAIGIIQNWLNFDTGYSWGEKNVMKCTIDELGDLPSVSTEKTGLWIPVSERLPEDGIYLVTVERIAGVPRIETKSFAKDLNRVDDFSFRKHKCGWYDYDSEYGCWEDTNVIAWMPLPKPYKPQESEDVE